jgi:4,5-dihydroxyphthalate decarboxylase
MTELLLRTALGRHDHVQPLRDGRVQSKRIRFEWVDMDPLPRAFRTQVRGGALDLSEMAIITHLMAHRFDKPLIGLAIPLWWRLPHANLICTTDGPVSDPRDLEGRKVGVRAYGQTSGVWVRGVLAQEYGVDLNKITWGTMEDAHLEEYEDPAICVRYPPKPPLRQLLLDGEFAAIMGERVIDPAGVRTVIPDAEAAARAWIERTGIEPVNHCVTLRQELVDDHPWLAGELMELFEEARRIAVEEDGAKRPPAYGLAANRAALQCAFDYAHDQQITDRRYPVEELFLPL